MISKDTFYLNVSYMKTILKLIINKIINFQKLTVYTKINHMDLLTKITLTENI
jgi:hypothetical protein